MPEPSCAPSCVELAEGRPPPGAAAWSPPLCRQVLAGGVQPLRASTERSPGQQGSIRVLSAGPASPYARAHPPGPLGRSCFQPNGDGGCSPRSEPSVPPSGSLPSTRLSCSLSQSKCFSLLVPRPPALGALRPFIGHLAQDGRVTRVRDCGLSLDLSFSSTSFGCATLGNVLITLASGLSPSTHWHLSSGVAGRILGENACEVPLQLLGRTFPSSPLLLPPFYTL